MRALSASRDPSFAAADLPPHLGSIESRRIWAGVRPHPKLQEPRLLAPQLPLRPRPSLCPAALLPVCCIREPPRRQTIPPACRDAASGGFPHSLHCPMPESSPPHPPSHYPPLYPSCLRTSTRSCCHRELSSETNSARTPLGHSARIRCHRCSPACSTAAVHRPKTNSRADCSVPADRSMPVVSPP